MPLTVPRGRVYDGFRRWSLLCRALVHEVRAENLTFMAGSIAYHAFVSLLPLLVLLVLTLSSFGGETLAELVFDVLEAVLTPRGRQLVTESLEHGSRVSGVSLFGFAILLWATLRIFRGLDQGFSAIYETESENTIVDQVKDGLLVLMVVVLAVLGAGIIHTWISFPPGLGGEIAEVIFAVGVLTGALFPLYYIFPDTSITPVGALPGTVFAAIGVATLESLFRFYADVSSTGENYGILGGVIVLLTWLYVNSFVLLFAAALNAVLTNRSEDVDVQPFIGDHRPGTGRTFGEPLYAGRERNAVRTRLETISDHLDEAEWLTVSVDGDRVRLPVPENVVLRSDDRDDFEDGTVGIKFQW